MAKQSKSYWWMLEDGSGSQWELLNLVKYTRAAAERSRQCEIKFGIAPKDIRVRKVGFIDNLKD